MEHLSIFGPNPQEGLISKITLVLEGDREVLETLNEEELEIMKTELSVIRHLKDENPSEIDSKGVPGKYKLDEKYDRSNRYGIFGDN